MLSSSRFEHTKSLAIVIVLSRFLYRKRKSNCLLNSQKHINFFFCKSIINVIDYNTMSKF